MTNPLILTLKRKLEDLAPSMDAERQRNVLKEELQYYVLNFIYHHETYSQWIMYGGSALRICHDLDRMSVDLDFEITHPCTEEFLSVVKADLERHFKDRYELGGDNLTVKINRQRGITLQFLIGGDVGIAHPSKQVHVKIDLNHFIASKTITERIPINHDQLSFVITTYNMSALMASKIAAIFLRGERGVGEEIFQEKGRDIYDLLWYMGKKIIPDLDYLKAKSLDISNLRKLFDTLTIKMNAVSDKNLRNDLLPLFLDQARIENWLAQWRENYLRLLERYEIHTTTNLQEIFVHKDFLSDNMSFAYFYNTQDGKKVRINYLISGYWVLDREGNLSTAINEKITDLIVGNLDKPLSPKIKQYVTLFHKKTEDYLKRTNNVVLGDAINTKMIRMTADNLNQKEQIVLDRSSLLSCELEDLLK